MRVWAVSSSIACAIPTLVSDTSALTTFHDQAERFERSDRKSSSPRGPGVCPRPAGQTHSRRVGRCHRGAVCNSERGSSIPGPHRCRFPRRLAFAPVRQIGGANGWYFANFLWWLRGTLDLLVGGVGLRRGRRDPHTLAAGDALDFWRVESFEPDRRLSLAAEMKVPGRAWLQFEVEQNIQGSVIRQTAIFDPAGLAGLIYWYALYPVHRWIFSNMLQSIAAIAERKAGVAS